MSMKRASTVVLVSLASAVMTATAQNTAPAAPRRRKLRPLPLRARRPPLHHAAAARRRETR